MREQGEVWDKGPQVMKDYYNRPVLTAEVLQDGRLATCDIATADGGFSALLTVRKTSYYINYLLMIIIRS